MKHFILPLIAIVALFSSCSNGSGDQLGFYDPMETSDPKPSTPTRDNNDDSEMMVYVTPSGNRYHISSCGTIVGHDITELSVSEAEEMGRTPCKKCHPDYRASKANRVSGQQLTLASINPRGQVYTSGYSHYETSQVEATGYTVYITPHGKKYHRASCWHIKGHDVTAVDVSKAQSSGRTPCKDCKP